ncbi:MAG: 50S ribosomal protein L23 [Candidatus Lambdaproteobacteria bacterium RIFOXYD12_FULL_49_8]|uniref:Large ribosomal subunit protein uL23 n=1 Tax=Candidatus Lambdaproteobacteria bacterium RIFOXYD2_FULL_50_16 TaxID=1817772 RepID=A0A1F6G6G7_9PROT|nr:MAG: 50S ribosomal protein L23 [Candidatus Lambdaproteobacteria bacterium RIFOXYD2_FULL_50_16]OGG96393.1 MAG: 50S ribosomal protein L23 [Candidatus Lambdaproteobacteria bacterium RIFOXYD12_FULL_49_8]
MRSQFTLIKQPHITEKVLLQKETENKVVFKVAVGANKVELKRAIESIFGVTVEKISTVNVKGKSKRLGLREGKRSDWKKAIVTLKEGDNIEYFEGA